MTMETKHFAIEELKFDDAARTVKGFGSTFGNVDSYGDIVLPGAFVESLKGRKPAMLWQHRSDLIPGVWTAAEEKAKGLYLEGTFADTPLGHEAYTLAKMGAVTGLSIGFSTKRYSVDPKKNTRQLEEVELYEVSLVTFPANEKATITHVKAAPDNERDFEELLREAGYARDAAKIIVARGFKALNAQREADEEVLNRLAEWMDRFAASLTTNP